MSTFLTVAESAKNAKVSERTILREIKRGNIVPKKAGRKYLIPQKEFERYLNKNSENTEKSIEEYLLSKKTDMIDFLQCIVSLPSAGYDSGNESVLAQFLVEKLKKLGLRTSLIQEKNAIAVRVSFGYADEGLLLDCPLDTAPVGDIEKWSYPPYAGVIRGGKMYGRGTADAKSGMIAMIYALLALKGKVDESKFRVELVFDGGEQDGSYTGMDLVLKQGLHVQAGIVGYAKNEFDLPIGARGYHRYTLTFHGQVAHTGSRSQKGVNAIEAMADFMSEFEKHDLRDKVSGWFPFGANKNFSMVSGGETINIVPDEANVRLDVRTTDEFGKDALDILIQQTIERLENKVKGLGIEVSYDLGEKFYIADSKGSFIQSVQKSIKDVYKKEPKLATTGPAHIGNLLSRNEIPVVLWGPTGGNVHGYNEYVEIESLPKTSLVYTKIIMNYFGLEV